MYYFLMFFIVSWFLIDRIVGWLGSNTTSNNQHVVDATNFKTQTKRIKTYGSNLDIIKVYIGLATTSAVVAGIAYLAFDNLVLNP